MKPTAILRAALISKCAQEVPGATPGIMDRIGAGATAAKNTVATGLHGARDTIGAGLTSAKDWIGKNPGTTAGIAGGVGAAALLAYMLNRDSAPKKRRGLVAA